MIVMTVKRLFFLTITCCFISGASVWAEAPAEGIQCPFKIEQRAYGGSPVKAVQRCKAQLKQVCESGVLVKDSFKYRRPRPGATVPWKVQCEAMCECPPDKIKSDPVVR